jgi:hypothetical protein
MQPKTNSTVKVDDLTPGQLWQQRFDIASSEQETIFEKFKDYFQIMYAARNTKSIAPWRSKLYIPILAGKAWDFITRLSDVVPRFDVTLVDDWEIDPQTGKVTFASDALDRCIKISKKLERDYVDVRQEEAPAESMFNTLLDATVTGTGVAKVGWSVEDNTYYAHELLSDNVNVDIDNEIKVDVTEGYNYLCPVNIFNVFVAPNSDSLEKAPWVIIREHKTLDELKDAGVYENLDELSDDDAITSDKFSQYNYARNMLLRSQDRIKADSTVKFFEVFECFDMSGNILTFIGTSKEADEGWHLIREQNNPYWHGRKPLQTFYIRRKPYSFWGESLFENNETLQYAANDVWNHYMDNLNLALDGGIMMDENAFVEDYVVSPGFTLFYKNEKPDQFKFPEPNPAQLSTVLNNLESFVESATVPAYSGGVANSKVDKTQGTATGVSKLMEAADGKLGFMRSNFKKSLRKVGIMWLSNAQQFMDSPQVISHHNGNQIQPMMVTPADLQGRYNIDIDDDSMTPTSKSDEQAGFDRYVAQLLALQKASMTQAQTVNKPEDMVRLDFNAIIKEQSVKYGQKQFTQYILEAPSKAEMITEQVKEQVMTSELTQAAMQKGDLMPPAPPPPRVQVQMRSMLSPEQSASILAKDGGLDPQSAQGMAQTASQAAPESAAAGAAQTSQTMANPTGR